MALHHAPHQREAKAGAFVVLLLGGEEGFKDLVEVFPRNAFAIVTDLHQEIAAIEFAGNADLAALTFYGFNGVHDEVDPGALQIVLAGHDLWHI